MLCGIEILGTWVAKGREIRHHCLSFTGIYHLSLSHEDDVIEHGEDGGAGLVDGDDDRVPPLAGEVLEVFKYPEGLIRVQATWCKGRRRESRRGVETEK